MNEDGSILRRKCGARKTAQGGNVGKGTLQLLNSFPTVTTCFFITALGTVEEQSRRKEEEKRVRMEDGIKVETKIEGREGSEE